MELNVHHCVQKSPLSVPILKQMNLVCPFHITSLKIHFNIFSHLCLDLTKWFLFFTFPHQNTVCISLLPHACMWNGLTHLILLDFIVLRIFDGENKSWSFSLYSFLRCLIPSSPIVFLSTLFSNCLLEQRVIILCSFCSNTFPASGAYVL